MKKYIVTITREVWTDCIIEANSIEEAQAKALKGKCLRVDGTTNYEPSIVDTAEYDD